MLSITTKVTCSRKDRSIGSNACSGLSNLAAE
jgi:hypothetical protein